MSSIEIEFVEELESILDDIKRGVSRSVLLVAIKASSGLAQDTVRCSVIPKDRLPIAYILCRLTAGLIGHDESEVEIPYPTK